MPHTRPSGETERLKLYGADWCPHDPAHQVPVSNAMGVEYEYINVEKDSAASDWVKSQNRGKEKKPTIQIGAPSREPSNRELEDDAAEGTRASLEIHQRTVFPGSRGQTVVPGRSVSKD